VSKVTYSRSTNEPRFDLEFPEALEVLKNQPLEFVLTHYEDLPLKYLSYRSELAQKQAREASNLASAEAETSSDEEVLAAEAPKRKSGRPKKVIGDVDFDLEESEVEFDSDGGEETEEMDDLENDDGREELAAHATFDAKAWKMGHEPEQGDVSFTGAESVHHCLPDDASPLEYFLLYVPLFWFTRWANWTNLKAELVGGAREWHPTSTAEVKAWIAALMFMCLCKNMSPERWMDSKFDKNCASKWFGFSRWKQIRRYFKASNPADDVLQKGDKLHKVRQFLTDFLCNCRRWYTPGEQISIDELDGQTKRRLDCVVCSTPKKRLQTLPETVAQRPVLAVIPYK
jgi:hypothetical protein